MCELEANDWVVDETLSEGLALVGIFDGFFVADTGESETLDDDADALVVEVCHDDLEALILLADQVLDWHLDVFEGNIRGAAGPHSLAVHPSCGNTASFALD